ncbi:hypothetical protein Ahy_B02g058712 [Arachis hypogaea]|uniref:Protein FAR1-RELATED SEQUENCE n=1 Tax=Arachis hypogaea TaxID=3818 RepID=A0A445AF87_ARAHY|nr:hypothetical protein Ahy_B02g058712 [Arachis hypogaea]
MFHFSFWCISELFSFLYDVDEQLVPKVEMTFNTLENAIKFYKDYSKIVGVSTRIRSTNKKKNKIKNQLIICSYVSSFTSLLSKSSRDLKQHRELSMSVRRTIENNEEVGIRPSKTYQSFVAAAGSSCEKLHHKRSIECFGTRGCKRIWEILIKNESEESEFFFELEFEVDQSIKIAFWANTRSRAAYEYFGDVISFDIIYNTNRNWNDFLMKYGLGDNKWLSGVYLELFEDRHLWILVYLDHYFWTRMRSTQRSKSMHAFLNKFIARTSLLIQFVKQYDNCLGSREQRERELDAANFHTVIPCATKSSIEAQFQYVYTLEKFRKVQAQFRGKVNCITISTHSALGYTVYEVVEQVSNSTFNKFAVTYDRISAEVKCQCLLFESRGILCRHSLSVLSFERVNKVSPRYILERWSKNVKRRHIHIKSGHDEFLLEPISKRFDNLVFRSQNICKFASEFEKLTAILHRAYDNVMVEMQEYKAKRKKNVRYLTKMLPSKILTSFKASTLEPFLWWFTTVVKFQPISWTCYELSVQRFSSIG